MKSRRRRSNSRTKQNARQRTAAPWPTRLGATLRRWWQRWQKSVQQRQRVKARARFWSEVRAGQREAKARHEP